LLPLTPWRLFWLVALVGVVGGGIFGFVRGLSYLPTLPFAVIEGAILIGVPVALLGLVASGLWTLGHWIRRLST
jgi:hypothetical protein